jgi:hypothetical protein
MLLEKVSIHTEILFVHCYKFFLIISCSFSVFVENCILLPKGLNEFVVFLCIVHVWFWFFILLPRFLLLVIFFRYKNVASKSFYQNEIQPFPLMLMQRNEMWYMYIYTVRNLINNLISLSFCSQLFQPNGCKYKIQYYYKKEAYWISRNTGNFFCFIVVYLTCTINVIIYNIKKVVRTVLFVNEMYRIFLFML